MKKTSRIRRFFENHLAVWVVLFVAILCASFIMCGTTSDNGSITLNGEDAVITESTEKFIEDAEKALERIMNESVPTDETTEAENDVDEVGLGFTTTIDDILARRLPDGNTDGNRGWQCSKYTAYLATGRREYSTAHPDYGPVNGKDIAEWLVKNYGFKYVDKPVAGAIGSGGFNTKYGHTAMYLYSTGANTAMVNDANYSPLAVATHNMNITGWVWVVPGNYEPTPKPTPTPTPTPITSCKTIKVAKGDTMSAIMKRCTGNVTWGSAMMNYANAWISERTGKSVYYGWTHGTGYGLIAGDTIYYSEK